MSEHSSNKPLQEVPVDGAWVHCPACDELAIVALPRVTCTTCGLTTDDPPPAESSVARMLGAGPVGADRTFGLPYWLQISCLGHRLWAANPEHLAYLQRFLSADHRPNRGLGTGLPHWITSSKYRPYVLRGLAALERRAASVQHL
ncbi:hypothetical protein [Subtercola endophyticus]|uniref:hypothetical protein n=1 Tax=Subtercola endophyticus TaxID=2895559 RepID=UPI001E553877|nr:hypothetical protein [Subtercola endophyticus]UFS58949.1 hypothetical protein LQ955_18460 [Subtercola endophyticus]